MHGGAMLANIGYRERRNLNSDRKAQIAHRVASDIPSGASLFLNTGTTTEAVAKQLLQHEGLMIVTNNMNVANILVANESCDVTVVDASKFQRKAPIKIASLSELDRFYTDIPLAEPLMAKCDAWGTEVRV